MLWLTPFVKNLLDEPYSPKIWEKWLHAFNYGKVYYFASSGNIFPVHFNNYRLYKKAYNEYGGYFYISKRYKTPLIGECLNLCKDFFPTIREEWFGGDLYLPKSLILLDKRKKWW